MSNAEMERLLDRPMAITRREYNADMLTASKMGEAAGRESERAYTDLAVAEARAPLVEALRAVEWVRHGCEYEKNSWCPACDTEEHYGHAADCPRAAALAKEVP